jgi:protein phosphatase 4 regulatory subunit 3
MIVTSEADSSTLLAHPVSNANAYQRQGDDTIITWTDAQIGTDVALSFQEGAGCNRIWRQIQEAQFGAGGLASTEGGSPLSPGGLHRGMVDEFDGMPMGHSLNPPYDDVAYNSTMPPVDLPEPALGMLPAIAKALTNASHFQREALASQLLSPGYLSRLMSCFRTAHDLEDENSMAAAYATAKAAILLNDTNLLETLFSEEYVWVLISALEADPDIPLASRARHRDFLQQEGAPREVIPIQDPSLRAKIHAAYRMGYVKDTMLPRALDDATFATLSSLQLFNNVDVLIALQQDPQFFPLLFLKVRESVPQSDEWRDLVGYLQEVASLARHLQPQQRHALLGSLVDLGLFNVLATVLDVGDDMSRLRAIDILLAAIAHDPAPVRTFLLSDGSGRELFAQVVTALLRPSTVGLQEQAAEVLRMLLDPETMENSVEKDRFIDTFYEEHITLLHEAVQRGVANRTTSPSEPSPATLVLVIELLCYCVTHHSYRIKYFLLRNNMVEKVLKLLRRREIAVAAAALRFLRTCVGTRDEFYNRHLIKHSLFEPVITAFLSNGRRYNLLNSAALELFDFVRRENLKGLVTAVVESPQWRRLEGETTYVDTMHLLRLRYEANQEGRGTAAGMCPGDLPGRPSSAALPVGLTQEATRSNSFAADEAYNSNRLEEIAVAQRRAAAEEIRRRRGEKEEDADEENYFRESSDDDEERKLPDLPDGDVPATSEGAKRQVILSPGSGMLAHPLVDYDDDDEDTLPLGTLSSAARGAENVQKRAAVTEPLSQPADKRPRSDMMP